MWDEIKHQILMFHYINQQCPIFAIHVDPNLAKILFFLTKNFGKKDPF